MSVDPALLGDAVKRNDVARVRELLREASEADRRACAKALRPLLRGPEPVMSQPVMVESMGDLIGFVLARMTGRGHEHAEPSAEERERDEWNRIREGAAFLAAALGLAGGVAAAVRAAEDHPSYLERPSKEDVDAIAGVLADRHPEWLADFVNRRLSAEFEFGFSAWPLARKLVTLGVIDRPDIPGYATKFPAAIGGGEWGEDGEWRRTVTVHDALLADPGLLEDEVWRLFTVPDAAWRLDEEWADALARLAAEGHLDRDRLIDATLDAFTRDFAPNRVGWYVICHDRMAPSVADMACLALAWGTGQPVTTGRSLRPVGAEGREAVRRTGEAKTMAGILSARVWEACRLVSSGRPVRLLAEPEFERGVISPDRLLDRLTCWPASPSTARPPPYDLEVALLRLAPGAGDSFWSAWAGVQSATARTAQRVYTGGLAPLGFEPVVGEPAPWHPHLDYGDGYPHVLARITEPPAGTAAHAESHSWRLLTALASPLRDHPRLYAERYLNTHYDPVVATWPLLCPWQPELAAAHLLRPLSDGLKPGPSPATTAAGCLASPGHALGTIGHLALVTGLASAEPSARIAAAGVWSRASLDGRLDPALAASAIVTGVTRGAFKLNRIADGLQHASREPLAGFRIIETVFAAAGALVPAKPANLHPLFELAARTGAATGVPELPAAVTGLAGLKAGSRLATTARRLAEASGSGPAPARGQAIAQALNALVSRAEA